MSDSYAKLKTWHLSHSNNVKNYDDKKWSLVRYSFMHDCNFEKYKQDEALYFKLMNVQFNGKTFVEASPTDRIWGVGIAQNDPLILDEKNWKGQNLLGKVITQVRNELMHDKQGSLDRYDVTVKYGDFGHFFAENHLHKVEVLCSNMSCNLKDNDIAKLASESDDYVDAIDMRLHLWVDNGTCIKFYWHLCGLDVTFNTSEGINGQHADFSITIKVVEVVANIFKDYTLEDINEKFYVDVEQKVAKEVLKALS